MMMQDDKVQFLGMVRGRPTFAIDSDKSPPAWLRVLHDSHAMTWDEKAMRLNGKEVSPGEWVQKP